MQELFDSLAQATETNFENSVAVQFGAALLAGGYLLYWQASGGLQTPDGWYASYQANQAAYLTDAALQARIQAAKGLLTIVERPSALPRMPTRPTTGGEVGTQTEVAVPAASIEVDEIITGPGYEIGTRRRVRNRVLSIDVVCRDLTEFAWMKDLFPQVFDAESTIDILDHDGGTLAVLGSADIEKPSIDAHMLPLGAEAFTYEVNFQAVLEFVA